MKNIFLQDDFDYRGDKDFEVMVREMDRAGAYQIDLLDMKVAADLREEMNESVSLVLF
jgi:hypothetical protein